MQLDFGLSLALAGQPNAFGIESHRVIDAVDRDLPLELLVEDGRHVRCTPLLHALRRHRASATDSKRVSGDIFSPQYQLTAYRGRMSSGRSLQVAIVDLTEELLPFQFRQVSGAAASVPIARSRCSSPPTSLFAPKVIQRVYVVELLITTSSLLFLVHRTTPRSIGG